jgi:hypothetical protein
MGRNCDDLLHRIMETGVAMKRTELVSSMNDGAALLYAMALTACMPRYRTRLFASARLQRAKAALAWCGVPRRVLQMLPRPLMCDRALGEELALPLAQFKSGQLTLAQINEMMMAYFEMPMPSNDYEHLIDYIHNMMTSFIEEAGDVKRYAYEIGSVIEAERDHAVLRTREAL